MCYEILFSLLYYLYFFCVQHFEFAYRVLGNSDANLDENGETSAAASSGMPIVRSGTMEAAAFSRGSSFIPVQGIKFIVFVLFV